MKSSFPGSAGRLVSARRSTAAFALALLGLASFGQAANYFWDDGTVTVNATSEGGTGAWTAGVSGWEDGATAQNWANGNAAVFGGTAGTVTLGGAISATGVTIGAVDGYTITGNTLTLSSASGIATGGNSTINSALVLGAAQSWSVANGKTLTLGGVVSGANTLTYGGAGGYVVGGLNSNSGNLTIDTATVTVNTGATLFCNNLGWAGRSITLQNGGTLVSPNYANGAGGLWGQCGDGAANLVFATGGGTFKMTGTTMDSTVNKGITVNAGVTAHFNVPTGTTSTWSKYASADYSTSRDFYVNGGTLDFNGGGNFSTTRGIRGSGNVTKSDAGTLTLGWPNTFTGSLSVNAGTLDATAATTGNASAIGGGANTINVASGATLRFSTNNRTAGYHSGAVNLNGGTITFNTTDNSFASGKTLTFDTAPGTINGSGELRMRDANAKYAVTAAASGSTVSVATLKLTFAITGGYVFEVADGAAANDLTISSAIVGHNGNESITKTGAGTLALTGTCTYTGATAVNAGTLVVGGTLGNTPVTVAGAAALGGTGILGGTVTVNSGGTLAAAATVAGNVTVNAGATLDPAGAGAIGTLTANAAVSLLGDTVMEINKSGPTLTSDQIAGSGSVAFGGNLTITASGDALVAGDTFTLFSNTSGRSGAFATAPILPGLDAGLSWDLSALGTSGTITVVNYVATPYFTPPAGNYAGQRSITITSDDGATIYYTTDGSPPNTSSTSGLSPVTGIIVPSDTTMTIRAYAVKAGQTDSPEASATYVTLGAPAWNIDGSGLWSNAANWLTNVVAEGSGIPVDFFTVAQTTTTTVTLDSNRTVGSLTFGNTAGLPRILAASGGSVLTLDGTTPTITVNDITATVALAVAGTQGLSKAGTGTLVLSGANTYSGGTVVSAGTLKLGAANVIPNGTGLGDVSLIGTLDMGGFADTINGLSGSGTVDNTGVATTLTVGSDNATSTFDGVIHNTVGALSLTKTGAGTLTLTNTHTYTGATRINGGVLEVPVGASIGSGTSGVIEITGATLRISGGSVSGNGNGMSFLGGAAPATLEMTDGSLTLGASLQYWDIIVGQHAPATWNQSGGATNLNVGTLYVGNWADATGSTLNLSGGTFSINGTPGTTEQDLILGVRSSAALNISGTALASIPKLRYGHSTGVTPAGVVGTVNLNGGTLQTGAVIKSSLGTATFNFNGGQMVVTADNVAFMTGLDAANVRDGGAIFDTSGFNITIGQALVHSTIGGDNATDGGLTKSGPGALVLTGTCTYTGPTTVSDGTLEVDGSTASPTTSIATGATLAGTGTLAGTVTVSGSVAPGTTGTGTLSTGDMVLLGTYECQLDGANSDRLAVTGNLDLNGCTIHVSETNPATAPSFLIATYSGALAAITTPPVITGSTAYTLDTDTPGEIRLVSTASGFAAWAAAWASPALADTTPAGDPDGDGIANLLEYVLGGDPRFSDAGILPTESISGGNLLLGFRRSDASETDVTLVVEWSTDLVNWSAPITVTAATSPGVQVTENDADPDDIVVSIPLTNASGGKLFTRVKATRPE